MIHVGDIGTLIELVTDTDLSTAISGRIYYTKPDGDEGYWVATISGYALQYITLADDIDQAGGWKFQGWVEFAAWQGSTSGVSHRVGNTIVA